MSQVKVELQEHMGSDRSIAESAWTSSLTLQSKEKRSDDDVKRIVEMLINDKHASPIESVIFKFWIKMPISTDRQHVTHRICSHNGMSGRYRTMPSEYLDMPDDVCEILEKGLYLDVPDKIKKYYDLCNLTNQYYKSCLEELKEAEKIKCISNKEYKRAREFLRGVLPQHNMTERVTIMNLRSFANYQKLRNSEHAQPEIRYVAELMLDAIKKANICPVAIAALEKNQWQI